MQWFRVRVLWRDGDEWISLRDEIQGETYTDAVKNAHANWQDAYSITVLPGGGR